MRARQITLTLLKFAILLCLSFGSTFAQARQGPTVRNSEQNSLDYFFQLLNGLKADDYVPGSIECTLDIIATNDDFLAIFDYFSDKNDANRPTDKQEKKEQAAWTILEYSTAHLPSLIYNCYFIPQLSSYQWREYIGTFRDMEDFEAGFIQNLMGNAFTIQDILGEMNAAIAEDDTETALYQVGRLFRRIFDFEPMKSASLEESDTQDRSNIWEQMRPQKQLRTSSLPFEDRKTVQDMRDLHDSLSKAPIQHKLKSVHPSVGVTQSFIVNSTQFIGVGYYAALGFAEGAFNTEENPWRSNITRCRVNSIRMGNNMTLLSWYASLDYGVDRVMKYSSESLTQLYPFAFHCYYAEEEARSQIQSDEFMSQSNKEIAIDSAFEMVENADALRRIVKLLTTVYPERVAAGDGGFLKKDWFVLGQQAGILFKNVGYPGDHEALSEDDADADDAGD